MDRVLSPLQPRDQSLRSDWYVAMTPTSILADMLLIARMGFIARDNKSVRTARLTERATEFRKAAACSTWNDKTGSAEIRQAIVNLVPPGATNTRSLGGYLSKSQLDLLYNVNRGTAGNRGRKTAQASGQPKPQLLT